MNLFLLIAVWLVASLAAGAYIGFIGAIAWRVAQWFL